MTNKSGIHPQGTRLLIKTLELETVSTGGIILATVSESEREEMGNTTGEIVELGTLCSQEPNTKNCKGGDRIVFAKYAGLLYLGKDGKKYRVIDADNVVAILDSDVKLVDPYLKRGVE